MRTMTGNATTKTQTQYATEPVTILAVEWSTGTQYYGDKTFVLDLNSIQGKLLDFAPLQATGKQDSTGQVSSATVKLDDVDGALKILWNTIIMEGTHVTVYQHYEGNAWADLTLLFKGRIGGTIEWSEGERYLSFEIETFVDDTEVGYIVQEGDFPNLNPDIIGTMIPIIFGGVLRVKAIPIKKGVLSNNTDEIYGGWPDLDSVPFEVKDGNKFPQNQVIDIVVASTRFTGYFEGNIFHRQISNLLWYEDVVIAPRVIDDEDTGNNKVLWITGNEQLAGKFCWLGTGRQHNFCEAQEGNKCYFSYEWDRLVDETDLIEEVRGSVHNTWYYNPDNWLVYWYLKPNLLVYEYNKGYNDVYVVNEYPSTQIVEVMAKRSYNGEEIFVQVPSSHYTINVAYSLGARTVTAIEFPKPLSTYEKENWRDDIFVSVRSSLPANAADVIKWIVETYMTYGIDTVSFDLARIDVAPYPVAFALLSPRDAMSLIEDIAWQARCALYLHDGVISIKYLSKDLMANYTLTTTDVLLKTFMLGFVTTEEIYTKTIGKWKVDYSGENLTEKQIVYTGNIAQYGLRTAERDIFIYNIEELVKMTVYFWGYRYSNSWRIAQYPTLLTTLPLELFDCVLHNLTTLSTNTIRGLVEDISHDSANNTIAIKALLCSKAGQHSGGQPIEDSNFWTGDPSYPVQVRALVDPLEGRAITAYIVPVTDEKQGVKASNNSPTNAAYKYVFMLPTQNEIERSTNFPVKIQLQDLLGVRIYSTVSATLSLISGDADDRLSGGSVEKAIVLTSGEYSVTNEQIIDGVEEVLNATLTCTDAQLRANYASGASEPFKIVIVKTGVLTWHTGPAGSYPRGTSFAIRITGGLEDEIIDVALVGADALDKLYTLSDQEVTTITLDASGEYIGNWYIAGGGGTEDDVVIRLSDSRYSKYANSDSATFDILATTIIQSLIQTIVINPLYDQSYSGGGLDYNMNELVVEFISGTVADGTTYRLKATFKDSLGNTIDYDGNVDFYAETADQVPLAYISPGGGFVQTLTMTDGVYEGDFSLTIPGGSTSPATLYAKIVVSDVEYVGSIDQTIQTFTETTIYPTTNDNYRSRSYGFSSGSYFNTGANSLAGWQSEFAQANVPTQDSPNPSIWGVDMYTPYAVSCSHYQATIGGYSTNTIAHVMRPYLAFTTPYSVMANGKLVFSGCVPSGAETDTIEIYALPAPIAGASMYLRCIDILTKIGTGTLIGTVNGAAWTGTVEVAIPQGVLDASEISGNLYVGIVLQTDRTATNYTYPGVGVVTSRSRSGTATAVALKVTV